MGSLIQRIAWFSYHFDEYSDCEIAWWVLCLVFMTILMTMCVEQIKFKNNKEGSLTIPIVALKTNRMLPLGLGISKLQILSFLSSYDCCNWSGKQKKHAAVIWLYWKKNKWRNRALKYLLSFLRFWKFLISNENQ